MKRNIAVICWNNFDFEMIEQNIISKFENVDLKLFVKSGQSIPENHKCVIMPEDVDSEPKAKNYVFEYFRRQEDSEWVHIIEDHVKILRNPMKFVNDIEHLMDVLDINSFLGTTTDVCNRVYKKYNPRLRIAMDKEEFKKLGIDDIFFCSHSNTQWIAANVKKADDNELFFNTEFTIAMYWIIEFLARRRNTHPGTLYYMNQYITCPEEHNLFETVSINSSDSQPDPEKMKEEDAKFKAMNVNYNPDNNIDKVLEDVYLKLKSKI